jgi:hypothetical protein
MTYIDVGAYIGRNNEYASEGGYACETTSDIGRYFGDIGPMGKT